MIKRKRDEIFKAMRLCALQLGVARGVFYIFEKNIKGNFIYFEIFGAFYREADPLRGPEDNGANYLGVALGKLAQSLRTGRDSRSDGAIKGEAPYKGSVISPDGKRSCGFSGGTQADDLIIATTGMEKWDTLI